MSLINNNQVNKIKGIYRKLIPSFIRSFLYKLRHPSGNECVKWIPQNKSWQEVLKDCKGYDHDAIFEKVKNAALKVKNGEAVFERDSVLFYQPEYNPHLVQLFDTITKNNGGNLNLIDFGGSLGSVYFQYKDKLNTYTYVRWCVVEQSHFVDFGKKELESESLKFYYTIQDCMKENRVNAVLLSSVLSYLEDPYQLLSEITALNPEFIIIDKTLLIGSESDVICKQVVPESIYNASYPCRILSKDKLIKFMTENYDLVNEFDPYETEQSIRINDKKAVFTALVFRKKPNGVK